MQTTVITSNGRYAVSFKSVGHEFINEPELPTEEQITKAVMKLNRPIISCKPCAWDVTETYCAKRPLNLGKHGRRFRYGIDHAINESKLKFVRALPTIGKVDRKTLTVVINGQSTVYELGKKNEYFSNGQSLTKTLEMAAQGKGNKVQIF